MQRITSQECQFPDVIMALPNMTGEQQNTQNHDTSRVLRYMLSESTVHYRMDKMKAIRMIKDEDPPLRPSRGHPKWPHDGPIYIEFHQPILLTLTGEEGPGEPPDCINGMVILPSRKNTTILTVGTVRTEFNLMEHTIHHCTGTLTIQNDVPAELVDTERSRALRFYHRLADHMAAQTAR